jgi:outer membrane lipoprotein SlyB
MRKLALALALAGALSAARATGYPPQEFDFTELGTVESVRHVPMAAALRDAFEHAVNPETADELVIRIDDGRAVVLRQNEMRRFSPGQRVRLVSSTGGPRIVPE